VAVVLDTSVIIDSFAPHRPRHASAQRLVHLLKENGHEVLLPAHALLEMTSAIMCEKKRLGVPVKGLKVDQALPCQLHMIYIDKTFVNDYFLEPLSRGQFIDTAGGDMVFVAVARKHAVPLITEDVKMAKVARAVGVNALTIAEYLASCRR
jgi:predicted nucleic acid-binding protein